MYTRIYAAYVTTQPAVTGPTPRSACKQKHKHKHNKKGCNKKEARGETKSHTQHSRTNLKIPSLYEGCSKSIRTGTISPVRTGTQGRAVSRARSGLSRPVRTWHTRCSISHSHVTPDKDRQYLVFVALRITEKMEQKLCKKFCQSTGKTCTEI